MNKTMNPQNRPSSCTQTASFLNIARKLQGQYLLPYKDCQYHVCEICSLVGSILRVAAFSAHTPVPSATSLELCQFFDDVILEAISKAWIRVQGKS
jgi:hypothetical protein